LLTLDNNFSQVAPTKIMLNFLFSRTPFET